MTRLSSAHRDVARKFMTSRSVEDALEFVRDHFPREQMLCNRLRTEITARYWPNCPTIADRLARLAAFQWDVFQSATTDSAGKSESGELF